MADLLEPKTCKKCGEPKDRSEFNKHKRAIDGLKGSCKSCDNKASAERYVKNRDKIRKAHAEWHRNNAEGVSARKANYRKLPRVKEASKLRAREYRKLQYVKEAQSISCKKYNQQPRVKEANRIKSKKHVRENPEKLKARNAVGNAIRKGILTRPRVCSICPSTENIQGHHEDYSKPLDVEWLCRKCHDEKGRSVWAT